MYPLPQAESPDGADPVVGPPAPARSRVPDLLFEDEQVRRAREIRPLLETPEGVSAADPLHRVTVFLTYRCNLACVYCKTIARNADELSERPQKAASYSLADFRALIDSYRGTAIRHLHFTGGEAVLIRDLPAMVAYARAAGAERLSVTSNGTAPYEVFRRLIDSGLDEVRISIDADEPTLADELRPGASRDGPWRQTVRTIRRLSASRRGGDGAGDFWLILNAVIGHRNRERLVPILRFLLGLAPDDVKLITEVDVRDTLGGFAGASAALAEARRLLDGFPAGSFPLLRRKLGTVFSQDAIGLEDVRPSAKGDWRCYLPLTERTVDAVHYYPCSVWLREGGKPLGSIHESQEAQRSRLAAFVRDGDCLRDPICRRYCLNCTRNYNIRCNEGRGG